MTILKTILGFITKLVLLIIALSGLIVFGIWGLIELLIANFFKKRFWTGLTLLGDFILTIAVIIDVLGNVFIKIPANRLLIAKDGYQFGNRYDTISFVLGKNEKDGTLKKSGYFLVRLLHLIDIDHCKKTYEHKIDYIKKYLNEISYG